MTPIVIPMPAEVSALWRAQQALKLRYESTGLRFTLDGRLVGDIAEAIALQHFDLSMPPSRRGGIDALTRSGRTVQVKATGSSSCGPAFSSGQGFAEYLLFFHLDFVNCVAKVLYNGPEKPIRAFLPMSWTGTKSVKLSDIKKAAGALHVGEGLKQVSLR